MDDSGNLEQPVTGMSVTVVVGSGDLPVLDLGADADARRSPPTMTRARSSSARVPGRRRRLHHRHPVLQERAEHGHPRRQPLDGGRNAAATVTFTGETASGWQQATLPSPVADHRQHDLRRVVPHAVTGFYAGDDGYFAVRASTTARCTRSQDGVDGAERRLQLRRERVPEPDVRERELLGRRGVRDVGRP